MDEEHKKAYLEKYHRMKEHGEKFYPDAIYKDLLVSFGIFLLLVGLAAFIGVANEPRADPSDSPTSRGPNGTSCSCSRC